MAGRSVSRYTCSTLCLCFSSCSFCHSTEPTAQFVFGGSGLRCSLSDEAAMRSFMQSGVHRRVMARLPDWCDEAALAHWVQESDEPPSWPEACRRLQQEGRRSRVRHPSEAQRRFEIREPRTSTGLEF